MTYPTAKTGILKTKPYVGGDVNPSGVPRRIGLSSNENPLGPSPKAIKAMQEALPKAHLYPSGAANDLRQAIAKHHDIEPTNIVCGGGSEDLLKQIISCYTAPGDEVLFSHYSFRLYFISAHCADAVPVMVPAPNYVPDVDEILNAVTPKTKVVLIDNPANPIGGYIPFSEVKRLHAGLPSDVVLVLDGAYAEYMQGYEEFDAGSQMVEEFENVVMTRTFSKFYGLAGVRVGWCYAPDHMCEILNRNRLPFAANGLAQPAAIASLQDTEYAKQVLGQHTDTLQRFMGDLNSLGLEYINSVTNFVLVRFPDLTSQNAKNAYDYFTNIGISTRPVAGYDLPKWLRISLGTDDQMKTFVQELDKFLNTRRASA
ncbi:MAG: pyridoxal phosphate-dependent aminotransferase [Alphaproteobacteria bacterium]